VYPGDALDVGLAQIEWEKWSVFPEWLNGFALAIFTVSSVFKHAL